MFTISTMYIWVLCVIIHNYHQMSSPHPECSVTSQWHVNDWIWKKNNIVVFYTTYLFSVLFMKCQGVNKRHDIRNLIKLALFWFLYSSKTLLFLFLFLSFLSMRTGMDCVAPPLLSQIETVLFIVTVQSIAFVDSLMSSSVLSSPSLIYNSTTCRVQVWQTYTVYICWFSNLTWTHNLQ